MNWTCVDREVPKEFGCYDVTIEDCCSDTRLLNIALFRPKGDQWELLLDKHNYEGFRVIAWRDRGEPFDWKDLQEK